MSILVISTSLSPNSRSALMARRAYEHLQQNQVKSQWLDLRETPLPFCDAATAYGAEGLDALATKIRSAKGVLLAAPIYNYDIGAAGKNLLELTGRNWTGKVVGLMVAAGGQGSYMAPMAVANSLMLDFRCVIVPRFVYATGQSFEGIEISDADLSTRIAQLADTTAAYALALDGLTERPPL